MADGKAALQWLCDKFGEDNVTALSGEIHGYACKVSVPNKSATGVGNTPAAANEDALMKLAEKCGWNSGESGRKTADT